MLSFRITLAIEDVAVAPMASERLGELELSLPLKDFDVGGIGDELLYTVDASEIAAAQAVADEAISILAGVGIDADASVMRAA